MPISDASFAEGVVAAIIVDDARWLFFNRTNAALMAQALEANALAFAGEPGNFPGPTPPDLVGQNLVSRLAAETISTAPPNRLVIPLKFLDFHSGVSEEFTPRYDEYPVIGRHAPYLAYSGGSVRTFKFSVVFMDEEIQGFAMNMARILQSLTLPYRAEGGDPRSAPEVLLSILPRNFMAVRGIIREVKKIASTPLVEKYKGGRQLPYDLTVGSVAVDVTFVSTEDAADGELFNYLNKGHMLDDDLSSSDFTG